MKKLSIALNAVLLVLVIILFAMFHNFKKGLGQEGNTDTAGSATSGSGPLRIAFIDADTVNADYLLMRDFRNEVEAKQSELQDEYNTRAKKLQDEYEAYMHKKQTGDISEVEDQKLQQDMQAKKSELDEMQQEQQDIMKDAQDRNVKIQAIVQKYVTGYNKNAHWDYVLTYEIPGGSILYANSTFDITKPILDGLNRQYKDSLQKTSEGIKH